MPQLIVVNKKIALDMQFTRAISVGRHVSNSLPLPDVEVSRKHAQIFPYGDSFLVSDLGSRNGVYVNGRKVTKQQALQAGDEILIGNSLMFFNPPDKRECDTLLSRKGKAIWKKIKKPSQFKPARVTTFSTAEMQEIVKGWLNRTDATPLLPYKLRSPFLEFALSLDRYGSRGELCEAALVFLEERISSTRSVIMAANKKKKNLEILAHRVEEHEERSMVSKDVLRIVLDSEKCVFCTSCSNDFRFKQTIQHDEDYLLNSFIGMPIFCQDRFYGFIYLDQPAGAPKYDFKCMTQAYIIASLIGKSLYWYQHGEKKKK